MVPLASASYRNFGLLGKEIKGNLGAHESGVDHGGIGGRGVLHGGYR